MTRNLFGTDGVRGVANQDLSCDLAFCLGRAAARFLGPDICVGRDTRLSGTMLESALTAGIMVEGGRPHCCGIIPTPAVALLTVQSGLDGGIVISASHNPPEFNGIKFFSSKGMKLPDELEEEISAWVLSDAAHRSEGLPTGAKVGSIVKMRDARERYIAHAIDTVEGGSLSGLVVAVDCGHGASCMCTPIALQRLGATVHAINTGFNGTDINVECGSTHLEPLRELVLRTGADVGLAHDGDADRVLFVDDRGEEIDGDFILAICGADLAARGKLKGRELVSTIMCNLGFTTAMRSQGFEVVQTQVGDRYVLERMLADGAILGGEQSGHIIFLEHNTTGDGLVTALQLLSIMKRCERSLAELSGIMKRYPQVLVNVHSESKDALDDCKAVWDAVHAVQAGLGERGRVLVRTSGTEPLVRVMAEAQSHDAARDAVDRLVEVVKRELP
ncbi:phosphoglucosamine mutase [Coriobacterium glomerans PW2]|uniref:Phosphoglucosamine mutase n=1 Tax=Coriobacterium glomerans (strain ATCC 49209 / DSM 20642 / JCM 10262 / PW2) TaxID=700015 RepID=F2NAS0_CORGP|nr:phosphoglucosamine mutase [Coriobacterium glomerans]AEB07526.1 phosphoglucosamine mutase [Coriobacterium glomerans PW2]